MQNESHPWRAVPVLLLAVVLQTTWLARWELFGAHIDLPLLVALSAALLGGVRCGASVGFLAGLLTAYFAPWHVGSFVVSRTVSAGAFGFFRSGLSLDNPLTPSLCAAGGTVLADLVFLVMSPTDFSPLWWIHHALTAAALHAVAIWPLHWLMARLLTPPSRMMFA